MAEAGPQRGRTPGADADRFASAILARPAQAADPATRLAVRLASGRDGARLTPGECRALPDWIAWPADRRERLALLAGASAVAPDMAASLDGAAMQRIADWVGEDGFGRLLDLAEEDPAGLPLPDSRETLADLGRSVLRTALPALPSLHAAAGVAGAADMDSGFGRLHAGRAAALISLEGEG